MLLYEDEDQARTAYGKIASALASSVVSEPPRSVVEDADQDKGTTETVRQWIHTLLEEGQLDTCWAA